MDLNLEGKLALVTASTGGIGRAIAGSLVREGARVIVNGRSRPESSRVAAIGADPGRPEPLVADNGTAEGTAETIARSRRSTS